MLKIIKQLLKPTRLWRYNLGGKKPWSTGYDEYRWSMIKESTTNTSLLQMVKEGKLPANYGLGVDDRVVEYPWIFAQLSPAKTKMLDAGSTFNFTELVSHPVIKEKDFSIFTFYPECNNYSQNRISYLYGDLREMPFKDGYFDEVVCQSTIEHIDMDNSIYGYDLSRTDTKQPKSYSYLGAVKELCRVTKPGGMFLISFPYGKFENHGFFQQFDTEMVEKLKAELNAKGTLNETYFLYKQDGWHFSTAEESKNAESYNPHTGVGKGTDGAAHCRSICCIRFDKTT
ncbi:MAG: methyltransferase domain-containing protein [Flavobacteriaceae bacterium]|nr:methyltransferase domain-containing protein [Flavobacteriaceae bacterium]